MVEVLRSTNRSPRLVAVRVGGAEIEGFGPFQPAASVRVLLPPSGSREPKLPSWNGNEFVLPGGRRPLIRTFTPRRFDRERAALDVEVVVHGEGAASRWATEVEVGDRVGISGPGRGYEVDSGASSFFLAGDETAIAALSQLLEVVPEDKEVDVHLEVADASARVEMPSHRRATVSWHGLGRSSPPGAALLEAVKTAEFASNARVWVAGEAAAVQRVRRYLFDDLGFAHADVSVRGYWKHGRSAEMDPVP